MPVLIRFSMPPIAFWRQSGKTCSLNTPILSLNFDYLLTTNNFDKTYIRSCEADKGGGVYIAAGGKLELKQGQLSLNRVKDTPRKGVAVFNANPMTDPNSFNWTGGTIENHGTNGSIIEGPCNNTSGNTAN